MVCEMCGAKARTKLMMVDEAALQVCQKCERFATIDVVKTEKGTVITPPVAERLAKRERRQKPRDIYEVRGEMILSENYGAIVRNKRRQMNMSQEDLAKKINEKKSIIVKVENKDIRPSDKLIRKLEKALGISLKESELAADLNSDEAKEAYTPGMTLADFIKRE